LKILILVTRQEWQECKSCAFAFFLKYKFFELFLKYKYTEHFGFAFYAKAPLLHSTSAVQSAP
jgi:hypothetical protein